MKPIKGHVSPASSVEDTSERMNFGKDPSRPNTFRGEPYVSGGDYGSNRPRDPRKGLAATPERRARESEKARARHEMPMSHPTKKTY